MMLGGFGFLSRLHGLSIDALVEAEMVLADGSIVIVNETEHPGALCNDNQTAKRVYQDQKTDRIYERVRSLVGITRSRPRVRYSHPLQGQSVSSSDRLRWESHIVSSPSMCSTPRSHKSAELTFSAWLCPLFTV
jgi:hypothetical protein